MKRIIFLFILVTVVASCQNIQEKLLPTFTVSIPPIRLKVPPLPFVPAEEIPVGALKTRINMDSAIRANTANTFGANAVHTVTVKEITLKTVGADEVNNLSSFESARIKIFSDTSEVEIAAFTFPEVVSDSFTVIPSVKPDIAAFLKGETLSYNLYWKNRRPTTKPIRLQVLISLNVR
jgi:hypothetical protein